MFLKAGLLSLLLLLASRVLGVLRETALAAAFGSSGMADVAIVMLTLPDWLAGVLVSGALAYVLLPHWAGASAAHQNATQNRVARYLLWGSILLAGVMVAAHGSLGALLVPGVSVSLQSSVNQAMVWSALALPAAMLAGLWATRLQHERDFLGLYSANLVVNSVLIVALFFWSTRGSATGAGAVPTLGVFLLVAVFMRLLWQGWRMRPLYHHSKFSVSSSTTLGSLPGWRIWMWAVLGAGLPLTLPFVARTFASGTGEGALATFNYAWKLVELPLVLAIQLVASLAFPAIARAYGRQTDSDNSNADAMTAAVRGALTLAWTLACAAAAALLVGAPAIASVLFGWGRMQASSLVQIAAWGSVGAWGLLPQALLAVALTILATIGRMRFAVLAYALALAVVLVAGGVGRTAGHQLMWALNAGFLAAAVVAWGALGVSAMRRWVPVRALLAPFVVLMALVAVTHWLGLAGDASAEISGSKQVQALFQCAGAALVVIASGWFAGPALRQALRS
ncbi:hypothetical protein OIN59_06875 [Acidovorax sp. D2M1]|uniref:Peptidoglycan lipid II flippase n=1 Tax=Acidovorax benzenivorans TaxID=2987520 RepID=A0ABT5RTY4_9BURK|nr:lipid II flippase MurJ [Acidovorax benzenivorans]MDD2177153.1 hypothetical protein [Acidovorax benzenivorans]